MALDSKNDIDLLLAACMEIDAHATELFDLSQLIWKKPELGFNEIYAHEVLTKFLELNGFEVTRSYLLDTAFKAEFGTEEGPNIAVFCEYDALPSIGHGCGHNLIAEVGVAIGLAVKSVLTKLIENEDFKAKVTILGSPAEEFDGGKALMLDGGALTGIDAAVMAHPDKVTLSRPILLAKQNLTVEFHGRATDATINPSEGINALDAAIIAYTSISHMRQQTATTASFQGIITKGGEKSTFIPDYTELEYYVRAPTVAEVDRLITKIINCCKGAALSTGCTVTTSQNAPPYMEVVSNDTIVSLFEQHAARLGLDICKNEQLLDVINGSTDMGNVSYMVPTIHPEYYIGEACCHSREFTTISGTKEAQVNTIKVAKALSSVVLNLMTKPEILKQAKYDHARDIRNRGSYKLFHTDK